MNINNEKTLENVLNKYTKFKESTVYDSVKENIDKDFFDIVKKQKIVAIIKEHILYQIKSINTFEYEQEILKIKSKGLILKNQLKTILEEFDKANISYVISKGVALSFYLYDSFFMRDSSDIDIVVESKDFIKGCLVLEKLGYYEKSLKSLLDANFKISNKEFYETNMFTCCFFKEGSYSIELKNSIFYATKECMNYMQNNVVLVSDKNFSIKTFNEEGTFLNLLINSFKNLHNPYGILYDYRIRDILEVYIYIVKYKHIFTREFIDLIYKFDLNFMLFSMIKLFKEFFSDELYLLIPNDLLAVTGENISIDFIQWNSDVFFRFLDIAGRREEHKIFRNNNIKKKIENKIGNINKDSVFLENTLFGYKFCCDVKIRNKKAYFTCVYPKQIRCIKLKLYSINNDSNIIKVYKNNHSNLSEKTSLIEEIEKEYSKNSFSVEFKEKEFLFSIDFEDDSGNCISKFGDQFTPVICTF